MSQNPEFVEGVRPKRVGIDVDGVLALFSPAYAALITEATGHVFPDYSVVEPEVWYWEREAGIPKTRENEIWARIKTSHTFWLDLKPYPGAQQFLFNLAQTPHEIYFITNRMGRNVIEQTKTWLKWNGFQGMTNREPNVLLSRYKGLSCAALELDCYIDDKWENIEDVTRDSKSTFGYLLNKPYNSQQASNGERVDNLSEFAQKERLFA